MQGQSWNSPQFPLRLAYMIVDSDPEGARAYLDEAARLKAPAGDINPLRLRAWMRSGRKRETLRQLEETFLKGTPSPPRFLKAAEILIQTGEFVSAEAILRRAIRFFPDAVGPRVQYSRVLQWRGEAAGALKQAEKALDLDPGMTAALLARGTARMRLGRLAQAEEDLSRVITLAPTIEAYVWRGEARRRLGRLAEAISDADAALAIQGHSTPASVLRARALLDGGADEDAWRLEYYGAVVNATKLGLWPQDHMPRPPRSVARRQLGALFQRLRGDFLETTAQVSRRKGSRAALTVCRPPAATIRDRAIAAQAMLPLKGPEAALGYLARLQGRYDDHHVPLLYRGEFLLWLGRYEEGRLDFARALEIFPNGDYANFGIALATMLSGNPEEAVGLCAKVRQASLKSFTAQANLHSYRGEAHLRAGHRELAVRDLTRAVRLNFRKLSTWILLALALSESSEEEAAPIHKALELWFPELLADAAAGLPFKRTKRRRAVLEMALKMMKGNRSSWLPFYVTADGKMKFIERLPSAEMDELARTISNA